MHRITRERIDQQNEEREHIRELNKQWSRELEPEIVDLTHFMKEEKDNEDSER